MRKDRELMEYSRVKMSYSDLGRQMPIYLEDTYQSKFFIKGISKTIRDVLYDNAMSQAKWTWISIISNRKTSTEISETLAKIERDIVKDLSILRDDFNSNMKIYFVDGFTLTKAGRKRINELDISLMRACRKIGRMSVILPNKYADLKNGQRIIIQDVDYESHMIRGEIIDDNIIGSIIDASFDEIESIIDEICKNIVVV